MLFYYFPSFPVDFRLKCTDLTAPYRREAAPYTIDKNERRSIGGERSVSV